MYLVQEELGDDDQFHYFESHRAAKQHIEQLPEGRSSWLWSRKEVEPLENCLQIVKNGLESITQYTDEEGRPRQNVYELVLSGPKNFRDQVATTKKYKGNRDEQRRPTYYDEIKEYLKTQWGAFETDGIEADDYLGIRASEFGESSCIVSTDKDLDQIAGWHFNWVNYDVYRIGPREADYNFYIQLLSGDPTDNVPGLQGIGKAKATKALEGATSSKGLLERTISLYRDRVGKGWEEYLIEQARLVWIRRCGENVHNLEGRYNSGDYPPWLQLNTDSVVTLKKEYTNS